MIADRARLTSFALVTVLYAVSLTLRQLDGPLCRPGRWAPTSAGTCANAAVLYLLVRAATRRAVAQRAAAQRLPVTDGQVVRRSSRRTGGPPRRAPTSGSSSTRYLAIRSTVSRRSWAWSARRCPAGSRWPTRCGRDGALEQLTGLHDLVDQSDGECVGRSESVRTQDQPAGHLGADGRAPGSPAAPWGRLGQHRP